MVAEIERRDPRRIALDLAPEELYGLKEHFGTGDSEPLATLLQTEVALAVALTAYGEVRMPSPSFVGPVQWALARGRELLALEPDEEEYSSLFLENVRYLDLVRRARAERSLRRSPPPVDSPEALVLAWEDRLHRTKGTRRMQEERRTRLAVRLAALRASSGSQPLVAVLDAEHWEPALQSLRRT